MKKSEDRDDRRPKKKAKKQKSARSVSWRLPLLIGGAVAGVVVVGLVIWGVVRLLSPGGLYGPVAADARPAGQANVRLNPSPDVLPAVHLPAASDGWKLTPDAVPLASGLASAVVLPDGRPLALLFADPARARAAVLLAKTAAQPKDGFPVPVLEKSLNYLFFPDGAVAFRGAPDTKVNLTLTWAQVDLKAGTVVAQTPLGTFELTSGRDGTFPPPVTRPTLSPSGDRLAAIVPQNKGSLRVWDTAGKVVRSWDDPQVFAGGWLAFATEDRIVCHGAAKLSALDVASGQTAYTTAETVKAPFALSPGRKWLAAIDPAGGLVVFNTADGAVAGTRARPVENGTPAALAFRPDGTAVTATPLRQALWLDSRHLIVEDTLFDLDRNMTLWKYPPQAGAVPVRTSPDGRVWSVATFTDIDPNRDPRKFKPGPLADAVKQGKFLLAAFTVPDATVRAKLERAGKAIVFRRGEPVRVEVVGSGSVELQKLTAEGAAKALAKQGQAVDPEAKVGVRLELSAPKSVTVVSRIPNAPPGWDINKQSGRPGYQISCKVLFFNRENGVVTPPFTTHDLHGFADGEGRLDAFYAYVGEHSAPPGGILSGIWDGTGQVQMLGTTPLGIDGVLEP